MKVFTLTAACKFTVLVQTWYIVIVKSKAQGQAQKFCGCSKVMHAQNALTLLNLSASWELERAKSEENAV